MPLHLLKTYSSLLEIMHLTERERKEALYEIFRRDIEENPNFAFRGRPIRPFKGEEPEMQLLFSHLITHDVEENQNGQTIKRREFEMMRAQTAALDMASYPRKTPARYGVIQCRGETSKQVGYKNIHS